MLHVGSSDSSTTARFSSSVQRRRRPFSSPPLPSISCSTDTPPNQMMRYARHTQSSWPLPPRGSGMTDTIYKIEATLRGKSPERRFEGRQLMLKPLFDDLRDYLSKNLGRFSTKGKMAEAINYTLNHWQQLTYCLLDGRVELDTNTVERSIRPIALSRRNSLFAGSDAGADNWSVIASLLETCKLSDVDPLAWLTTTLQKLAAGHSNKDLDSLMPWHFPKIAGRNALLRRLTDTVPPRGSGMTDTPQRHSRPVKAPPFRPERRAARSRPVPARARRARSCLVARRGRARGADRPG
ncbi:transposase [Rhizorhabdus histidinilytica]